MSLKSPQLTPKSLRPDLVASSIAGRNQAARRRSSRMALKARVTLAGQDVQKCAFTMPAKATNLNRHGAAIHLPRGLRIGSTIVLRNQRGAEVSARVVAQLAVQDGISVYGIEFVDQGDKANNFWGITFPSNLN